MTTLNVNGKSLPIDVPDDTSLLGALRDGAGLTGPSSAAASPSAVPAPCPAQ